MYCGKCGAKVQDNAYFCQNCGEKLKSTSSPPEGPSLLDMLAIPALWLLHKIQKLLKNLDSKKILGIVSVCLALVILITLIGSLAGGYEKKVVGDWYEEGNDDLEFSLYSDGSCVIPHHWGKGEWSIVNGDQLHISDFYGQTWCMTIVSVNSQKLVVGPEKGAQAANGATLTYWHTPNK